MKETFQMYVYQTGIYRSLSHVECSCSISFFHIPSPCECLCLVQEERISQRQEVDVHLQHRRTIPRPTAEAQTLIQRYRTLSWLLSLVIVPIVDNFP